MKKPLKLIFILFILIALFISGCKARINKGDIAGEIVKETEASNEVVEEEAGEEEISLIDQKIEELNEQTKDFNKRCWGAEHSITSETLTEETDWRSLTESYRSLLDDPSIELKCNNIDHCYNYVTNFAKKINPGLSDDDFSSLEKNKEKELKCEQFKPDKIVG